MIKVSIFLLREPVSHDSVLLLVRMVVCNRKEKKGTGHRTVIGGAPGPRLVRSSLYRNKAAGDPSSPVARWVCETCKVDDLTFLWALSGRCTADCEYPCWGRTLRGSAEGRCLLDILCARLGIHNISPFARSPDSIAREIKDLYFVKYCSPLIRKSFQYIKIIFHLALVKKARRNKEKKT